MTTLMPWKRTDQRNGIPLVPVSRMRWDWDRMFDRFLDDVWAPATGTVAMPLDVCETDEEIRVRVEVPGFDPERLEISLSGEVLTLSGEKTDDTPAEGVTRHYSERAFGAQQRAVKLPCPVDPDRVRADHEHGIVTITLQKAEAVRPKRIKVKSA